MKPSIVILTGAGISAESGIKTFRDHNGLWENHRIEDVASPEGYQRNPSLVQNFYNLRRRQLKDLQVQPNKAHLALAELEAHWKGDFLLVTQNVDNLHERAGSKRLLHMHGELSKVRCEYCETVLSWEDDIVIAQSACLSCSTKALRPHIVWFGEMPLYLEEIFDALRRCDIFISIGTSGQVYPAAGFVEVVPRTARRIEVNLDRTDMSPAFNEHREGKAGDTVPSLIKELLA